MGRARAGKTTRARAKFATGPIRSPARVMKMAFRKNFGAFFTRTRDPFYGKFHGKINFPWKFSFYLVHAYSKFASLR